MKTKQIYINTDSRVTYYIVRIYDFSLEGTYVGYAGTEFWHGWFDQPR